jgi:hypothetical protein
MSTKKGNIAQNVSFKPSSKEVYKMGYRSTGAEVVM